MLPFLKYPDVLGFLVLNEDGAILASGGQLENSEYVANVVTTLLSLTAKLGPDSEAYKKITVSYSDCSYVMCVSNMKTYIVKKRYQSPVMPTVDDAEMAPQASLVSQIERHNF